MKKSYSIAFLILLFCTSTAVASEPHAFILDAISWREFSFDCLEGDLLSGEFQATSDGSQYPGDEQKYDDWVPLEIDFFVLNESAFRQFAEGNSQQAHLKREGVSESTWQFRVPSDGTWYAVYDNDSIYLITIEDTIYHSGQSDLGITLAIIFLTGLVVFLSFLFYLKIRK